MGLRINSNNSALTIQRQLEQTNRSLLGGLRGLSSGLRINRAADDAAGLAIAEGFRADVRQANEEAASLQTGANYLQTADGGLSVQQEGLQRVRELAVQAGNGTLTDDQRAALNNEAQQILEGIDQTAAQTEFNGQALLDGSQTGVPVDPGGNVELTINESTTSSLGVSGVDISTQAGAAAALDQVDTAITNVSQNRAAVGAQQNRVDRAMNQREIAAQNSAEAESAIRDLDVARATIESTRNQVLLQAGTASLAQSNLQGETAARLLGS
jgi:flagellin